ncbi:hypothetical protein GW17_00019649 [Ensete ventricosum]|nr:hypothetical protein GW17_00019649 [Ensete ventricosum]
MATVAIDVGEGKKMRKRIRREVLRWPRRARLGAMSSADEGRRMVVGQRLRATGVAREDGSNKRATTAALWMMNDNESAQERCSDTN